MRRAVVFVSSLSFLCLAFGWSLLTGAAAPAPSASVSASAPATARAVIEYIHHERYTANLTLSIDSQPACTIALQEQPTKWVTRECAIDLPASAREFVLSGEFAFTDKVRRSRARGTQRWRIVDLAPVVGPLRDASRPFGQRVRDFVRAKSALEKTHPTLADDVSVEPAAAAESADAIKAAESRLGFPLPPEHVSLLRDVGAMEIDDSSFMAASTLNRADRQMLTEWGTPAEAMKELSSEMMTVLRASTMLYTEVGDGLGALLYEPALPSRPSGCGRQPAYYWIHQEGTGPSPERLMRADGKTCASYTEAVIWLLAQQVFALWEDEEDPHLVLVDRSAPTALRFLLSHRYERNIFSFDLDPRWDAYE